MHRLTILLTANLVLTLVLFGWMAWVAAKPRYWFPNAYKEPTPIRGERGEAGPQGPRGLRGVQGAPGLPGTAGIDGADGIDAEAYDDSDLVYELETLVGRVDYLCDADILVRSSFGTRYIRDC